MIRVRLQVCGVIIILMVALAGQVLASSSATYRVDERVVEAFGTTSGAAARNMAVSGGEAAVGQSFSTNYSVQAGYFNLFFNPAPTPTVTPTAVVVIQQSSLKILNSKINPGQHEKALIRWSQPEAGAVTIVIYNILGDKIITLVENKEYSSGQYHDVVWQGENQNQKTAASGIYIVHLKAPGYEAHTKIAVIK